MLLLESERVIVGFGKWADAKTSRRVERAPHPVRLDFTSRIWLSAKEINQMERVYFEVVLNKTSSPVYFTRHLWIRCPWAVARSQPSQVEFVNYASRKVEDEIMKTVLLPMFCQAQPWGGSRSIAPSSSLVCETTDFSPKKTTTRVRRWKLCQFLHHPIHPATYG